MTPSRFSVDPHVLDNVDLSKVEALRHWQHQVSILLEQIQVGIPMFPNPPDPTLYLDGSSNWSTPPGSGGGGTGDMTKAVYDTNNNGVVDTADSLAWSKLTGVPSSFTPSAHASTHITGGSDIIPAPTTSTTGAVPVLPTTLGTSKFLRGDATFTQPDYSNLTGVPSSFTPAAHHLTHVTGGSDVIGTATSSVSGLVPVTPGSATQFLAGGATAAFATPPSATATTAGYVPTPPNNITQFLRGDATWATPSVGAPPSSLTDLGSPAGNSTINTAQAYLVAVNLVWTTAANWTLTLQNVALGSDFQLRFLNSSGATRTFTITATNPSAASYTIAVYVPGSNALTGALSINNGNAINLRGVSYTVGGNPTIQLFGFGSTG